MSPSPTRFLSGAAAIALIVFVAYIPAMRNGFVWDDDVYVTANQSLKSLNGLGSIWFDIRATPQYYPLVFTSFWFEYRLWGLNAAGYHVVNVLLHALGAVLLWIVLRRLAVPGAWFAAAVFAVHPVHVESVAWITERKNVLSGVFCLSALLAYMRFASLDSPRVREPRPRRLYALAMFLFVCAMLSKTASCSLPVAILLVLWWKRERLAWRDIVPLVPMFVVGAALGLTTVWVEKHHVGAEGAEWVSSLPDHFLIAGRAIWFYAAKLVWPVHLTFIYPRWQIDSGLWWQYLYPLAALAAIACLWLVRRRIGKGPLAATLFFVATLAPALGFIDVYLMRYSFVADHFQYMASIGPIALIAALSAVGFEAAQRGSRRPAATATGFLASFHIRTVVPAIVLAVLTTLTWRQARAYRDLESLWSDTLDKNPSAWLAHNNLGLSLAQRGKLDQGIGHVFEALRLNPAYPEAHNNVGVLLMQQGNADEAIRHYREAVRIEPRYAKAHHNLGLALARQGRTEEAMIHYLEGVRLAPDDPELRYDLAMEYSRQGRLNDAIAQYLETLKLTPNDARAYNNMGRALARQGRPDAALAYYEKALRLDPRLPDAHNNLGGILAEQGRLNEAVAHYTDALRLKPDYPEAHSNLAAAFCRLGRLDEAAAHWEKAIELKPDYAKAHNNLATLLASQGRLDEAVGHYQKAIQIDLTLAGAHKGLGAVLVRQGKMDPALKEYREALRIDPADADSHCAIGDLQMDRGNLSEALTAYREALRINPGHAGARQKLDAAADNRPATQPAP